MKKLLTYILSIFCVACPAGFILVASTEAVFNTSGESGFLVNARVFFGSGIVTGIIVCSLYTLKSSAVPEAKRYLWVALIIAGNLIVLPFFWYWYVLNRPTDIR